jgi:hypothetical protein
VESFGSCLANGKAFVTCDQGSFQRDVLIANPMEQNRALDCDSIFVELYPEELGGMQKMNSKLEEMQIRNEVKMEPVRTWHNDRVQRQRLRTLLLLFQSHRIDQNDRPQNKLNEKAA